MRRLLAAVALATAALAPPAAAAEREPLDVRLLAKLPAPGSPASLAVARDGTIFTASYKPTPRTQEPSVVFALSPDGRLERTWPVQGATGDGSSVAGLDSAGRLYGVHRTPAFAFRLDPATGEQERYGTFPDLPRCAPLTPAGPCSPTLLDLPPSPNFSTFAPDGALLTTDFAQAVVWRTAPGGGTAEVFFADARLDDGPFGTSGIEWLPGYKELLVGTFASTGAPAEPDAAASRILRVPVGPDGRAGTATEFWQGRPGDFPDDLAVSATGRVYVALAGLPNALVVLDRDGREVARVTESGSEVPFDTPTALHFDGRRLLLANMSLKGEPSSWALFDVWAGEPGLPVPMPRIGG